MARSAKSAIAAVTTSSTKSPIALSGREARLIALAAQGFTTKRRGDVLETVGRLGVVQLDSVNVVARAHYLPLFSRIGNYDRAAYDEAAWGAAPKSLFEYWGHEASLLPVASHPLFRWRMDRAERGEGTWGHIIRFGKERRAYLDEVLAEVRTRGPVRASEITQGEKRRGRWWTRSDAKIALEWLFWAGRVSTATRRHFERIYDVTERVIPPEILAAKTPDEETAHRALLEIAARALGVATEDDLRDYFRLGPREARPRIVELVESGVLSAAKVEGWNKPAFLLSGTKAPRSIKTAALLAPFDPLIWHRARAHRLFDFHYRIEIYTPAHARKHGYYVLPFLLGDRLVGRVDLKAERKDNVLSVKSAHIEDGIEHDEVAEALGGELAKMASWLGLGGVAIGRAGRLAKALRAAS